MNNEFITIQNATASLALDDHPMVNRVDELVEDWWFAQMGCAEEWFWVCCVWFLLNVVFCLV
jgi:hypothetical protein